MHSKGKEGPRQGGEAQRRRLAFASPLNKYSPLVRSTYDPARLPEKSLIRHSLPPGTAPSAPDARPPRRPASQSLSPSPGPRRRPAAPEAAAGGGVNDSELPDSPGAIITHSGQMITATANLLGAWQRVADAAGDAAPTAAARRGAEASGWAALLGEFAAGGRVTFAQFQSALVAGDECKVPGLTEVREDADDLWTALVGNRGAAGAVSEIAELLTIACSERAASRAPGSPNTAHELRSHIRSRQSPARRSVDEDMCNVETDSLDGLRESMERLQNFIGTQPRASGEAIASLEVYLAKEPAARALTVPPRSAAPQEYAAAFNTVDPSPDVLQGHPAAEARAGDDGAPHPPSKHASSTTVTAAVRDWLLTPPSTQTSAAAAASAELAVGGDSASPAAVLQPQDEGPWPHDAEHWLAGHIAISPSPPDTDSNHSGNSGVSTPREEGGSVLRNSLPRSILGASEGSTVQRPTNRSTNRFGWPPGRGSLEESPADKSQTLTSPLPAPPPQPHLKSPQRRQQPLRAGLSRLGDRRPTDGIHTYTHTRTYIYIYIYIYTYVREREGVVCVCVCVCVCGLCVCV